jgi:inorganic pyrophosphatase
VPDAKAISAPIPKIDPGFADMKDISDVPRYALNQIEHFFGH